MGLAMSKQQRDSLLDFIDLLHRWNATYNLTAIRDKAAMLDHHVIDCLAAVTPFRRESMSPSRRNVLDVGSGGGLPGVILAIMQPGSMVTCVDSVGKKAAFIRQVATSLQLGNLLALHARVESLKDHAFDFVVSRAFSSLAAFVQLTDQALAEGGIWMAMKGKTPEEEMRELPPDITVFHVELLQVPGHLVDRCLVWLRRTENE